MPVSTLLTSLDTDFTPKEERVMDALLSGMNYNQTSKAAGVSTTFVKNLLAREDIKEELAKRTNAMRDKFRLSREQCVEGIMKAIGDAQLQADSMAQIAGWREIAKMLGHYEPEKKVITLSDERVEAVRQLEQLAMDELLELAGDTAIDGEFTLIEDQSRASH